MVLLQKWPFFKLFFFRQYISGKLLLRYFRPEKRLLGYDNKALKKSKYWHFSKGVDPWFSSKNGFFSNFFFRQYRPGNCLFRYSRAKKRLSSLEKKEVQNVQKNDIFPKGLTHGFAPKMTIFPTFFFRQYRPGKCLLRYSRPKKRLSRP